MQNNIKIIEGVKCYAPELAMENNDFKESSFRKLYGLEEKNFWFRSRNRIAQILVAKYFGNKVMGKFLEIGCGTGYVLKGLEKYKNLELYGAEIYLEGLKFAKKRLPQIEFVQLDATNMPFENEFDCIGAFDVLEHIAEDELVMKNVNKSLKSGGIFFVSVPQYMFMWCYLDDIACHKRRYSKIELLNKLRRNGFRIKFHSSFVFSLFPLMLLSRWFKRNKRIGDTEKETFAELEMNRFINKLFEFILKIDEYLIQIGIKLPFGGSLIVVAEKML
ncbi:MAG: class I SAM-dependent methyltransferase [Ignavibacteriae bacterium]|nr:class I SAM-dependent methyltransferase [Ignavibacteriota bacterium]